MRVAVDLPLHVIPASADGTDHEDATSTIMSAPARGAQHDLLEAMFLAHLDVVPLHDLAAGQGVLPRAQAQLLALLDKGIVHLEPQ